MVSLPERRRAVTYLRSEYEVSERRACAVVAIHRSSYRHVGKAVNDAVVAEVIRLSERHPRWGYRKVYDLIDRSQYPVSREHIRLIRRREGLQITRKAKKKRVLGTTTQWVHRATRPGHVWSYDFVQDQTADGRSLRCLTIVDEYSRENMAVEIARSLTSADVVRVLERLVATHGAPQCIRSDNGPEFIATAVKNWLRSQGIGAHYIDPGSPWQNAYCESFNAIFRDSCLDRWSFESVSEARAIVAQWRAEYNTIRPHGSLSGRSPAQFLEDWAADRRATSTEKKVVNS